MLTNNYIQSLVLSQNKGSNIENEYNIKFCEQLKNKGKLSFEAMQGAKDIIKESKDDINKKELEKEYNSNKNGSYEYIDSISSLGQCPWNKIPLNKKKLSLNTKSFSNRCNAKETNKNKNIEKNNAKHDKNNNDLIKTHNYNE